MSLTGRPASTYAHTDDDMVRSMVADLLDRVQSQNGTISCSPERNLGHAMCA